MALIPVGAGYRPELRDLFENETQPMGCVELIANRYFATGGFNRSWELDRLRGFPIILHGLSGNVASATGPSRGYLEQMRILAEHTGAVICSDHLAFTASKDRALGHLAPNLFDDELLDCACRNIELIAQVTGRRPCLENLASKTVIGGSKYTPEEFYLLLLERTDAWDCLLDLTNIWINGQNRPVEPTEFISGIPPERVRYVHLAGGRWIHGELVDSHSEAVHPEAIDLLGVLLETSTPEAVIIERDSNWQHAHREVAEDLVTVRRVVAEAGSRAVAPAKSA